MDLSGTKVPDAPTNKQRGVELLEDPNELVVCSLLVESPVSKFYELWI